MKHSTYNKGFSIIEVLVAISVITIGIIGAMNLINFTISSVVVSKSQVIAVNLVQEGMEIVRNIRDSNWLEGVTWNDGLGAGEWQVEYDSLSLSVYASESFRIDSNDFYQYSAGNPTPFYRKITINDISANEIKVVSKVTWDERGRSHDISAETRLYDWK